ncbi:MAG: hypothetical protein J6Q35_05045 [Rikenellaceae bacterium]|nr:hypothetical protein [Rikenellaceae bacterium]
MQEWLTFIAVGVCVVIAFMAIFRRRSYGCGCDLDNSCATGGCGDCPLKKGCEKDKSKIK